MATPVCGVNMAACPSLSVRRLGAATRALAALRDPVHLFAFLVLTLLIAKKRFKNYIETLVKQLSTRFTTTDQLNAYGKIYN